MLARTADNLFWLARYMERADFIARTIEATLRLEYLPRHGGDEVKTEWLSALEAAGAHETYLERHGEVSEAAAIDYLTFDRDNPSSICNCLENSRANGRAVRTALTSETWTAINDAWLELKRFEATRRASKELGREALTRFLDYVKKASLDFDGACYRTMLRNEGYWFNRLGLFLERADNTARLLDVKYHLLLPAHEQVGGSLDYFQWVAILRAVSANTAYHWVYRDRVKPWLVADLLILKAAMPRSLIYCYELLDRALHELARGDGVSGAAQRQARVTLGKLERARMTEIFQAGLHEFITEFIEENARLAATISEQYLFV
ncbi:MAG: alpha-E domain-containing protein [Pseudomonadota bacterium]|nr:alpha-E domain-containing protein [Pseudomonadota bacterium]